MRKDQKLKKSLHNKENIRLLEIVGLFKTAISAKQIIKGMEKYYPGSSGRYVYEQINQLIPNTDETRGTLLFRIGDEFNQEQYRAIVQKMKATFPQNLQFKELKKVDSYIKNDTKTTVIDIYDHHNNSINLVIQKHEKKVNLCAPFSNGQKQIPLMVKKKDGKLNVYTIRIKNKSNRRFLNIHFNDAINRKLKMAKISTKFEKFRTKAQTNKRYWLYVINLRGLILYSSSPEVTVKKIEKMLVTLSKKNSLQTKIRRTGVHSHNDIYSEFSFLHEYYKWKGVLPRFFNAELIKNISLYLKEQLETIDIYDLEYMVTSQLYDAIITQIFSVFNLRLEEINTAEFRSILEYVTRISNYLNSYDLNKVKKRQFMKNDSQQRLDSLRK